MFKAWASSSTSITATVPPNRSGKFASVTTTASISPSVSSLYMAFASFDLFATIKAADLPLFSVVFTDWLSAIAALGFSALPA
jgi:hypothetical protein